jgi:hypothetical protein
MSRFAARIPITAAVGLLSLLFVVAFGWSSHAFGATEPPYPPPPASSTPPPSTQPPSTPPPSTPPPSTPPASVCTISVSEFDVVPGSSVSLSGDGFPSDTALALTIHSQPQSLGTVTTDSAGHFATSITIPASLTDGSHTITASSASETCAVAIRSGTTPPPLAHTGVQIAAAGILAATLLGGGAFLLLIGRRRRHS